MIRFSIRDLLLATAIAALAVGWWLDRSRLAVKASESDRWKFRAEYMAERMHEIGGEVWWNDTSIVCLEMTRGYGRFVARDVSSRPLSPLEIHLMVAAPGVMESAKSKASPR
jgi:hypothetical protein